MGFVTNVGAEAQQELPSVQTECRQCAPPVLLLVSVGARQHISGAPSLLPSCAHCLCYCGLCGACRPLAACSSCCHLFLWAIRECFCQTATGILHVYLPKVEVMLSGLHNISCSYVQRGRCPWAKAGKWNPSERSALSALLRQSCLLCSVPLRVDRHGSGHGGFEG